MYPDVMAEAVDVRNRKRNEWVLQVFGDLDILRGKFAYLILFIRLLHYIDLFITVDALLYYTVHAVASKN